MKKMMNLFLVSVALMFSLQALSASKKAQQIDPNDDAANTGETAERRAPVRGADGAVSDDRGTTDPTRDRAERTEATTTTTLPASSSSGELGAGGRADDPESSAQAVVERERREARPTVPGEKPAPVKPRWVPKSQDVLTMTTCGNQKICIGRAKLGGYAKLGDEVFCEAKDGKCPSVEECVKSKTSMVVHRPNNFAKIRTQGAAPSGGTTSK